MVGSEKRKTCGKKAPPRADRGAPHEHVLLLISTGFLIAPLVSLARDNILAARSVGVSLKKSSLVDIRRFSRFF